MSSPLTWQKLKKMSANEVVDKYDEVAESTQLDLAFWRDELFRRSVQRQTQVMVVLTAVITVLTGVNVYLVWRSVT